MDQMSSTLLWISLIHHGLANGDLIEDSEKDPELKELQLDYDDENAEIGVSDNSFDQRQVPGDESDLNYDPSGDHQIDLHFMLTTQIDYRLSPHVYSIPAWIDEFCAGYDIVYSQTDLSNCVDQSAYFWACGGLSLLGLSSIIIKRQV